MTDELLRRLMVEEYAKENYGAIQAGLGPELRALRRAFDAGFYEGAKMNSPDYKRTIVASAAEA